jgi:AcrR family transcriptional regulator
MARGKGADKPPTGRHRGRARSVVAESSILAATLALLEKRPLCEITADAIAAKAGVSKATIYKWWPNKNRVALDAFLSRMTDDVPVPDTGSLRADLLDYMQAAARFFTSGRGRLFGQFIAEGQFDPEFLEAFRERFLRPRRVAFRAIWERAHERGELRKGLDAELVTDLAMGPIIYRVLAGHAPVSSAEVARMVESVHGGIRAP